MQQNKVGGESMVCMGQNQTERSSDGMERIAGRTEVTIECPVELADEERCGGWSETIELDEPVYIEGEYIHLPGFEWECSECGNPHEFVVDGIWVSTLV